MIDKKDLKRNYDKYGYILCKNLLPQDVVIELKLLTDQLVRGARSSNASNNIYEFIEEGSLLKNPKPESYARACDAARSDSFTEIS